jgi:hypothetical protein
MVLGLLTLVGLIALMGRWGYDDPFITYRYADNLRAGRGFVYNVGQQTLSTTAPLYAILLAGLGLLWADLPSLSNTLSALSLVLAAACLWGLAREQGQETAGLIAALLLTLTPLMLTTFGAETCLYVAWILGGLYAFSRSRLAWTAVLLALATMVRPDGLIVAAVVGVYHLLRHRTVPWRPVALYAGLIGLWVLGLWLYFGSPLPVTLLTKQQQGQMDISTRFGAGFLSMVRRYLRLPLYWPYGALILVGLIRVTTRARHWLPLLLWTGFYFLAYTLMGVSRYFWYYAPLVPGILVLVAEGAAASLQGLGRIRLPQPAHLGAAGLLIMILLAPQVAGVLETGWRSDPRLEVYTEIGEWLHSQTPAQASVGALEVGIIGYFSQRFMIDFAGLIQPEVARRFTPTTTYQESAAWTIQTYQPDYVVLQPDAFANVTGSPWFQSAYVPLRDFSNQQDQWLTVYGRDESQ